VIYFQLDLFLVIPTYAQIFIDNNYKNNLFRIIQRASLLFKNVLYVFFNKMKIMTKLQIICIVIFVSDTKDVCH